MTKIQSLFKRPKICKNNFLSFQSFKVLNESVIKSNSSPNIITIQNNDNKGIECNFYIYSNIYFKLNQPLFGYKIDLSNVIYDFNHAKIYPRIYPNVSYEYVPIYQRNFIASCGVLIDTPTMKRDNSRKFVNKLNKNTKIFKNYISAIIYNHNKNEIDSYSTIKDYNCRNSLNYNKTFTFKITSKNYNVDLDEISPVEDETSNLNSSPFNPKINEIVNKNLNKTTIEDDTNIIILQPLQLESMNKLNKDKQILSDHKKIVRLTIFYTLSFFALAIITFFVIYLT